MKALEEKRKIVEAYIEGLGLSHDRQRVCDFNLKNGYKWLFCTEDDCSVFIMLFVDDGQGYLWIEEAIAKQDSYSYNLLLYMFKTQYSFLHPYRLAISKKGYLVLQIISPVNNLCNDDFIQALNNLIEFSKLVNNELTSKYTLKKALP